MKPSPSNIQYLEPDQIFVFGSNSQGYHAGGAAKLAHQKFGAEWGVGFGPTGQCYAIDTMSGIDTIKRHVGMFLRHAKYMNWQIFLVTEIGCGIAGYSPEEIAPLFKDATDNVLLPERFIQILKS